MWSGLADTLANFTGFWRGRSIMARASGQQAVNGNVSTVDQQGSPGAADFTGASGQQAVNGNVSTVDQQGSPGAADFTATAGSDEEGGGQASEAQVRRFLSARPDFLEQWVLEEVPLEQLERWMIRSTQRAKKRPDSTGAPAKNGRKTSLSRWKFCVHADKRQMLQELTRSLQRNPSQGNVLWELAGCISSAVGAEGHRLYLAEQGDPEQLGLYLPHDIRSDGGEPKVQALGSGLAVPQYVARTREPLRLSRTQPDPRFPDWLPIQGDASHVLWQPVVQPDGQVAAVVELWRQDSSPPFHEEDEEIAISYLVWGGIALHYAHLYVSINKQRRLADFLLTVVKSIFQDMVSMDALVIKIMNFAQRLVDADRASLFLVDSKSQELYARVFDVGVSSSDEDGDNASSDDVLQSVVPTPKEIRFPLGTGIAGQVALTGDVLNISDAYCDPRFNRAVDQLTGYRTHSILCMPIFIGDGVIGVVQMVNKHSGRFLKEDEEAFEMFAVYCGLALHHAQLYDKIARSEQKYRVALDVLSYHNTCSEEEVGRLQRAGVPDCVPGLDHYYLDVFSLEDLEKARLAVYMFKDMFGLARFDRDSVVRFTLTVRKNYRRVPYHNWTHGFSVANSTYSIIKHSPGVFTTLEALALYVASLCHDLDHRGKNNKFMLETESPLAAIYSTSTMEHHHFNQTVTILQQKGHNIFSKLTNSEYKQVLDFVKHCILATDLAVFFPNRAQLFELVSTNQFVWTSYRHRLLLQAITMTASDLSASAKPWDLQVKTVQVIFQEFYEQGDAERAAGKIPIPMMDRNQPDQQAASQVGFLTGICIPCYSLLYQLIPSTQPLLDQCQSNLERWREIDEQVVREKLEKVRRKQEEANRRSDKEDEAAMTEEDPGAGGETKAPAADDEVVTSDAETAHEDAPTDADQGDPQSREQHTVPNTDCGKVSDAQYYDGRVQVAETTLGNENGEHGDEKLEQGIGEESHAQRQTSGHQDDAS